MSSVDSDKPLVAVDSVQGRLLTRDRLEIDAGRLGYMDLLRLHQRLYERTDGRIGHRLIGVPTLLLRTTGRPTGQQRTSALVYACDGKDYILVASNGGSDRPPGWLFNIEANPSMEIQVGRERSPATVRIVTAEGASYPRLWKLVNDRNFGRYDCYQGKTTRRPRSWSRPQRGRRSKPDGPQARTGGGAGLRRGPRQGLTLSRPASEGRGHGRVQEGWQARGPRRSPSQ